MIEKMFILILALLITGFISSKPLPAEDIKIKKKISSGSYKLQELKTNFLKAETKKIHVITSKTESSGMSKFQATMLGAGIGLVGGIGIGALIGSTSPSGGSSEYFPPEIAGAFIGGFSGLIIGGVTGYILGK